MVWEDSRIPMYFGSIHTSNVSFREDHDFPVLFKQMGVGFLSFGTERILTCAVVSFRIQALALSARSESQKRW